MPIDASIPLQGRQPDNLLQTLGQVYALKSQAQEQQLRGLGIQQAQQTLADQQGLAKAYQGALKQTPNGPSFDQQQFEQGVLQNAPRMYGQVRQQGIEWQKNQLDLQQKQLAGVEAHANYVAQHLQGISDAPPEQKQTVYTQRRNQMIQEGTLQPGGPQDPGALYPGDDAINRLLSQTMSVKDTIAAHQKDVENQVKALTLQETGRHNVATENQAQQTLQQTATRDANTAKYQAGELRIGAGRNALEGQRNQIESTRLGLEYGELNPGGGELQNPALEAQAKQIANGDVKPLTQSNRNPQSRMIMQRAYQLNPQLSDQLYATRQSFLDSKSPDAQNVKALGTAIMHANNALDNSTKMGWAPAFGTALQASGDSKYRTDADFLVGEVGKFVTGGALTVDEGKKLSADLYSARPAVRNNAITEMLNLAGGKLKATAESYKAGTGQEFPADKIFNDPEIKGALQKHGIIGGQAQASSPTPQSHAFSLGAWQKANPGADANAAKAEAIKQGYQVVQ